MITVANISDSRTLERKGIPLFIDLARSLPDFHFTIAGIQSLKELKGKLPVNVQLLGTQTRDELKMLYGKHQFYFQGSKVEGLPNVLCEAMLCECIPLGKAVFGISEAIGTTGLVFQAKDAIPTAIKFLTSKKKYDGANARKQIKEKYPLERREKAFLSVLKTSSK